MQRLFEACRLLEEIWYYHLVRPSETSKLLCRVLLNLSGEKMYRLSFIWVEWLKNACLPRAHRRSESFKIESSQNALKQLSRDLY